MICEGLTPKGWALMPELVFMGGHSFTDGESALTHTSCLEEPHDVDVAHIALDDHF